MEKARKFLKKSTFALLTTLKSLTVWITTNCGKCLNRWGYFTCLLRNLYAGQEAMVRTRHGTMDWFGKEYIKAVILSSWLFNL